MKIVVDANVVFAALMKSSITRELLLYPFISYYSPDFLLTELQKHKKELMNKANLSEATYSEALKLVLANLKVVSKLNYGSEIGRASKIMEYVDKADAVYLALSIAIKADGIWTYDRHFEKQRTIKALKTKDVAAIVWRGKKI
jgi:predicted nucleic acid-binding protein